jgi:hypothetical protein
MSLRASYIAFLLILIVAGCKKDAPVQRYLKVMFYCEAIKDTVYPMNGIFTNASTKDASYLWDFGNGKYSTEESPTVPFDHGGIYPVKLVVRKDGHADSITQSITIPYTPDNIIAIYLIPKGETFDPILLASIKKAIPTVQSWYNDQLGGKTFTLSDPVADTLHSDQLPVWFQTGGSLAEIMQKVTSLVWGKLGNRVWPFRNIIVVYLPLPSGNALNEEGVATYDPYQGKHIALVLGRACNDLLRPVAQSSGIGCYVTGHELGHLFRLPHNNDRGGIMFGIGPPYIGDVFLPFPQCHLLPGEKATVLHSEFIH